jgi:hypothetical protein
MQFSCDAQTHRDGACNTTRFADASAREASRAAKNEQLGDTALHGLGVSIQGLEESHPLIVRTVNHFATALSNMGI